MITLKTLISNQRKKQKLFRIDKQLLREFAEQNKFVVHSNRYHYEFIAIGLFRNGNDSDFSFLQHHVSTIRDIEKKLNDFIAKNKIRNYRAQGNYLSCYKHSGKFWNF